MRAVEQAARQTPGVVMLGHRTPAALAALYANAGAFVLPSSHEGQPIAVIEALGYGCPLILSDIPAHREIEIAARYFPAGDIDALAECLRDALLNPPDRAAVAERERILRRHDWRSIARHTLEVYLDAPSPARVRELVLGRLDRG